MFFLDELEKNLLDQSREYAKRKGFVLNPNEQMLNAVIAGLAKNIKEKGKAFCPCRVNIGNEKEDAKNVCPCVFHTKEIEKDGYCKCRLFFKK